MVSRETGNNACLCKMLEDKKEYYGIYLFIFMILGNFHGIE